MVITKLISRIFVVSLHLITSMTMTAQDIKLPAPSTKGGMPMNKVMASRHSVRSFDSKRDIDKATLGQVLWMTAGINRPDAKPGNNGAANRTNPTALNRQEIRVFVFGKEEVWEYIADGHLLRTVWHGDHRSLLAGNSQFTQDFVVDAPYIILFAADLSGLPEDEATRQMAMIDAGIACENLNLACVSEGLATVPRATMDKSAISTLLGFTALQIPILNNPIGYAK